MNNLDLIKSAKSIIIGDDYFIDTVKEEGTVYFYLKQNSYSESFIVKLRKSLGNILVNEKPVFINEHINIGDVIKLSKNPNNTSSSVIPCIIPLDIVFEDDDLPVINKKAGIACMPTRKHINNNLVGAIHNYYKHKKVVHIVTRLDKETSGLVLVAKNSLACYRLQQQKIQKTYYAVVNGHLEHDIVVNKNILTEKTNNINKQKRIVSQDFGKDAISYIYPEKIMFDRTLVKIKILHGRTHQIRVHLSSIGHSILGDTLYEGQNDYIKRTALHCSKISFTQPFSNIPLTFSLSLPDDMKILIN